MTVEKLEEVKNQDTVVESGIIIIVLDQSGSMKDRPYEVFEG